MRAELSEPADIETHRQFVSALARGLEVLQCFRPDDRSLSNVDIAKRTGLPKSTISRLTFTLTQRGFLTYDRDSGRYAIGAAVLTLGYNCLANMDIRARARPLMQDLADFSQVSVALGLREGQEMIYVEQCRGDSTVTVRLSVGSRIPVGASALGRAYLAAAPERERERLLENLREADKAAFPAILEGLAEAEAQIAERGFYVSLEDWHEGVNAVGCPILDPDGKTLRALNCGGPAFLLPRAHLETEVGPRLEALARQLSVLPPAELVRARRRAAAGPDAASRASTSPAPASQPPASQPPASQAPAPDSPES